MTAPEVGRCYECDTPITADDDDHAIGGPTIFSLYCDDHCPHCNPPYTPLGRVRPRARRPTGGRR